MVFQASRVAVIGAGVSGLTAAKHLKSTGAQVVLYERTGNVGGNWSYDERQPISPSYPSERPSLADFVSDFDTYEENRVKGNQNGYSVPPKSEDEVELLHGPPGPAYNGLENNIPTPLQQLQDYPWQEGTGDHMNVRANGEYLQGFWKNFGLEHRTKLYTRVQKLEKVGSKWKLQSSTFVKDGPAKGSKIRESGEFDAVVIASGHYHAAKIPDIPGIKEWKTTWPDRVQHSKGYRRPEVFKDQTVLLIGAGVSSTDIAREITPFAKTVYQSSRNGPDDIPAAFQPPFTIRVGELASFSPPSSPSSAPGSARITLKDGRVLTGIDSVVFCTGYITTYPFLADLHTDFTAPEDADDTVLVTDGNMVHNLHNDIFYIPDPSLAFVGVPYYVATFSLFEFQSIAVAAVFAGRAWLPSQSEMRAEYQARVKEKGLGRGLHSLKNAEVGYVSELVGWLNEHAKTTGAERVEGHSEAWIAEDEKKFEKLIRHFGVPGPQVEAVMKKFLSGRGGKEKRAVEEIAAA